MQIFRTEGFKKKAQEQPGIELSVPKDKNYGTEKVYREATNPKYELEYDNKTGEVSGLYDKRTDIIYPREDGQYCGHDLGMCMVFNNFARGYKLFVPNIGYGEMAKIYVERPTYVEAE